MGSLTDLLGGDGGATDESSTTRGSGNGTVDRERIEDTGPEVRATASVVKVIPVPTTAPAGRTASPVTFDGLALDNTFRVRVGGSGEAGKNSSCVDFRPVPLASETTLDVIGDGIPG